MTADPPPSGVAPASPGGAAAQCKPRAWQRSARWQALRQAKPSGPLTSGPKLIRRWSRLSVRVYQPWGARPCAFRWWCSSFSSPNLRALQCYRCNAATFPVFTRSWRYRCGASVMKGAHEGDATQARILHVEGLTGNTCTARRAVGLAAAVTRPLVIVCCGVDYWAHRSVGKFVNRALICPRQWMQLAAPTTLAIYAVCIVCAVC